MRHTVDGLGGWGQVQAGWGSCSPLRGPLPFHRLHLYPSFAELKRGNSQDLTISPKLDRYKIARQLTEKAIKVRPLGAQWDRIEHEQWDMQSMENYRAGLWGPLQLTPQIL